ncbi:MAG: hypothetical protein K8T25_18305 [Planctomycetia bacterium]|nr:hypothetical protein [Planctomycetia bacterium]
MIARATRTVKRSGGGRVASEARSWLHLKVVGTVPRAVAWRDTAAYTPCDAPDRTSAGFEVVAAQAARYGIDPASQHPPQIACPCHATGPYAPS